jgi:hypothetical protein
MSIPHRCIIPALLGALLLNACAAGGSSGSRSSITIDSQPQGAKVYAGERALGPTPATIVLDDVFPKRWTSRTEKDEEGFAFYRRLGTLSFRKGGCEPYTLPVDSDTLRDDIKVTLTCDPNYQPPAGSENEGRDDAPTAAIEQRLRRLDELRQKGLLTEEEYRIQRQRIISEL